MRYWILFLLLPNLLWASSPQLSPKLQPSLQLLNNGQILEALSALNEMDETDVDVTQYLFLKAMTKFKIAWLSTYSQQDLKDIEDLLDKIQDRTLPKIEEDNEARFFYAASIGLRAQISATEGDWWQTAKLGKQMKNEATVIIEKDPDYYPAYYLLGSYNYFADALPGYLKFLRLLVFLPGGDRKEGLKQLTLSYEKGGIVEDEAGRTLAIIYTYYEQDFEQGKEMTEKILDRYPLSYDTALYKGIDLYFSKQWEDAVQWFEKLRSELVEYSARNESPDEVVPVYRPMENEIRYWIARTKIQQGKTAEAREILMELANPPVRQPYWLLRGVYLSLAQLDYLSNEEGRANGYVYRVLSWQDAKDAHEKAKKLRKKKGKVETFDIDLL
jgi:hypothetical protein